MKDNPCLGVVIPVYNEERQIARLLLDWHEVLNRISVSYRFIIIDDGSTDGTPGILQAIAANFASGAHLTSSPEISIYTKMNAGHGTAILAGYRMALDCEWVFQVDSDHLHDTAAFGVLWKNRDLYDLLLGERKEKNASLSRRAVTFISRISVRLLFGRGVKDVNSPYRLMRASALKEAISHIPDNSFAPNILLTAWFVFSKARVYKAGVDLRKEGPPRKSKMNGYFLKGSIRALFQTIKFRFRL
jgi:dolichol-phosphate mannosyltransferase